MKRDRDIGRKAVLSKLLGFNSRTGFFIISCLHCYFRKSFFTIVLSGISIYFAVREFDLSLSHKVSRSNFARAKATSEYLLLRTLFTFCILFSSFKDQISADIVQKQLKDLSLEIHTTIQPVFVSRKIEQELNVKET